MDRRFDPPRRAAALHLREHFRAVRSGSFQNDLDRSVFQIARRPTQPQRRCLLANPPAEPDPLHLPGHPDHELRLLSAGTLVGASVIAASDIGLVCHLRLGVASRRRGLG